MQVWNKFALATGVAAAALLAACDDKAGVPKGQVVATVNGEDVTISELNGEVNTLPDRGAALPQKLRETVALNRVVERKMLADVARERNLDKNPQYLIQQRRVEEGLLVQALQQDIASKVTTPTRADAQRYVEANPQQFRERTIFTIDQIQFLRPANIDQLGFGPARTMADVERILTTNNIEFRRAPAQVDSLTVDPKTTAEINRIIERNPQEVFMFAQTPRGAPAPVMFVNQVTSRDVKPFGGERAIALATQILQRQNVQKQLQAELKKIQDAAKPNVSYAEGYRALPAPGSAEAKTFLAEMQKQANAQRPAAAPGGTAAAPADSAAAAPVAPATPVPAAPAPAAN